MARTRRNVSHYVSRTKDKVPGSWWKDQGQGWSTYERFHRGLVDGTHRDFSLETRVARNRRDRKRAKAEAHNWVKTANAFFLGAR